MSRTKQGEHDRGEQDAAEGRGTSPYVVGGDELRQSYFEGYYKVVGEKHATENRGRVSYSGEDGDVKTDAFNAGYDGAK